MGINNVPGSYNRTMVASLQPSKVHVSKNSNIPYDRPLLNEFITTFVIDVPHPSGVMFTFKKNAHREGSAV